MAEKSHVTVSESFVSQEENERRENVQRVMEEYAALSANSRDLSSERTARE